MRYPKLRELKEAITSLVTAAHTSKFPYQEHIPFENFRGKPVVDDSNCVGCEACANVCPAQAITIFNDMEKRVRTITRNYGKCVFCGQCEANCITRKGVKLSNRIFDLSAFDRNNLIEKQEKELLLCESCGSVITTKAHVQFLHYKLGAKAFSSILALNLLNERLKLAEQSDVSSKITDDLKRKDMFNIICPNCLRKVLVRNLS